LGLKLAPNAFDGGVPAATSKILRLPRDATDILIINPVAGRRRDRWREPDGTNSGTTGVPAPMARLRHPGQHDILIIDPVAARRHAARWARP